MTQPHTQLLTALAENTLVKAAVVMDGQGRVRGRTGHAAVLRQSSSVQLHTSQQAATDGSVSAAPPPRENIYMVAIGHDVLVVVFDESSEFERVRGAVDTLIKSLIPAEP